MKKEEQMFDQLFDSIPEIEASPAWEQQLYGKINKSNRSGRSVNIIIAGVVVLVALNLYLLSGDAQQRETAASKSNYRSIASEFMISTSSSKY